MAVPVKITPDNIRDSIVEVKYTSSYPYEILVGIFYQTLKSDFKYSNKAPLKRKVASPTVMEGMPQELVFSLGNTPIFFYNEKLKVQFQPGSIIFNCLDEYVTWKEYYPQIRSVIDRINTTGFIESYERIGLRYINEYKGIDMSQKFVFIYPMIALNKPLLNTVFKTEFTEEAFNVILNLTINQVGLGSIKNESQSIESFVSIVDVDVIKYALRTKDISEVYKTIEAAHTIEKEILFNRVLSPEFLKTLNPQY